MEIFLDFSDSAGVLEEVVREGKSVSTLSEEDRKFGFKEKESFLGGRVGVSRGVFSGKKVGDVSGLTLR